MFLATSSAEPEYTPIVIGLAIRHDKNGPHYEPLEGLAHIPLYKILRNDRNRVWAIRVDLYEQTFSLSQEGLGGYFVISEQHQSSI